MKTPDIHQFIGRIYDAALNPALWEALMMNITDAVGGTAGVLVLNHDGVPGHALMKYGETVNGSSGAATFTGQQTLAKYTRFPPEVLEHYIQNFFLEKDIWYREVMEHCRTGSVFIGSELIQDRELTSTEFYHEVLKPGDGGYLLGGILHMSSKNLSAMTISRPCSQADFGKEEKSFLEVLLPHLTRAYQLHSHYLTSAWTRLSIEQLLHRSSTATLLIDEACRITFVNRSAETILEQQDGLVQKNRRLVAQNHDENRLINRHIVKSINTARGLSTSPGCGMTISRPSGKAAYQVLISPLNLYTDLDIVSPGAAVCVLIHDPHSLLHLPKGILRDLYRLTPAECEVAQLFYQGRSLSGISAALDIGITTVRTHLYHIMEKTGTHTQVELMKLLARCPGALAGYGPGH